MTGTTARPADPTIDALSASFDGDVIGPADGTYDEAREVFNAMFDRRPAVIARCASTEDVVAAVRLARRGSRSRSAAAATAWPASAAATAGS